MKPSLSDIELTPAAAAPAVWTLPDRGVVGMVLFIIAESAIFTIFVVAYLFYLGKSLTGPTPRDVSRFRSSTPSPSPRAVWDSPGRNTFSAMSRGRLACCG